MRVIGEDATVIQALITGNIDAAILPYGFAGVAKRAGLHSLADTAELKAPFQGSSLCLQRGMIENHPDRVTGLIKGIVEALVFVLEPSRKAEVTAILSKSLRLATAEDVDASYRVLRLMTTLGVAPIGGVKNHAENRGPAQSEGWPSGLEPTPQRKLCAEPGAERFFAGNEQRVDR